MIDIVQKRQRSSSREFLTAPLLDGKEVYVRLFEEEVTNNYDKRLEEFSNDYITFVVVDKVVKLEDYPSYKYRLKTMRFAGETHLGLC